MISDYPLMDEINPCIEIIQNMSLFDHIRLIILYGSVAQRRLIFILTLILPSQRTFQTCRPNE